MVYTYRLIDLFLIFLMNIEHPFTQKIFATKNKRSASEQKKHPQRVSFGGSDGLFGWKVHQVFFEHNIPYRDTISMVSSTEHCCCKRQEWFWKIEVEKLFPPNRQVLVYHWKKGKPGFRKETNQECIMLSDWHDSLLWLKVEPLN